MLPAVRLSAWRCIALVYIHMFMPAHTHWTQHPAAELEASADDWMHAPTAAALSRAADARKRKPAHRARQPVQLGAAQHVSGATQARTESGPAKECPSTGVCQQAELPVAWLRRQCRQKLRRRTSCCRHRRVVSEHCCRLWLDLSAI
jgi:hypothetical protein